MHEHEYKMLLLPVVQMPPFLQGVPEHASLLGGGAEPLDDEKLLPVEMLPTGKDDDAGKELAPAHWSPADPSAHTAVTYTRY